MAPETRSEQAEDVLDAARQAAERRFPPGTRDRDVFVAGAAWKAAQAALVSDGARGWFADIDPDETGEHRWQACLETGTGIVPTISIWFATEEDCLQWIRDNVLGVGLLE